MNANFIQLTDPDGIPFFVNGNRIKLIIKYPDDGYTTLRLERNFSVFVKELPENIIETLQPGEVRKK